MSWLVNQTKLLRQHGLVSRLKAFMKKAIRLIARRGIAFINARPRLRLQLISLVKKLGLHEKLRSIFRRQTQQLQLHGIPNIPDTPVPISAQNLTPDARRIYTEIKAAMEKQRNI